MGSDDQFSSSHLRHPIMASRVMLLLIDSTSAPQNYSPDGRFNTLIVFSQVHAVEIIGEPRAELNPRLLTPIRHERSCSARVRAEGPRLMDATKWGRHLALALACAALPQEVTSVSLFIPFWPGQVGYYIRPLRG